MTPIDQPQALLGGLSPAQFMRRHWHKQPLLVRQAVPDIAPLLAPRALFALAARDDVESRLVVRRGDRWSMRRGPLPRRALPGSATPGWTLLVQGLEQHLPAADALLARFRFVPQARLDDLMLSYASDGGGVGPHIDAYDVFLLQVTGQRRWRFGRCARPVLRDDVPLKMLARLPRTTSRLLQPGDLLYLPPGWAHEGSAVGGDCTTASIGFRAPTRAELAQALLPRIAEADGETASQASPRYRDGHQKATSQPGEIPPSLRSFARVAVARALSRPGAVERALGEWLTEPKAQVWFERGDARTPLRRGQGVVLDARTRMAHAARQVFINGESFTASGSDATLVRRLADARSLSAAELQRLSADARALLAQWLAAGWLCPDPIDHA